MFRLTAKIELQHDGYNVEVTPEPMDFWSLSDALDAFIDWRNEGFPPSSDIGHITKLTVTVDRP